MLHMNKGQIRPRMEYCCHIWSRPANSSLSIIERDQKGFCGLADDELSLSRNVTSYTALYRDYAMYVSWSQQLKKSHQGGISIASVPSADLPLCKTDYREDDFLTTTILISSCPGLTVIFPTYPHPMHFRFLPSPSLLQSHYVILCLGWHLGYAMGELK